MLTVQNTEAIRRIEEAIGYTFHDKRLLVQVLTRKTYLKIDPEAPDNEVLEFYGDTLMNYHVTNYFMSKYAHMLDDGLFFMRTVEQFTDMRSHYVCNRYLTDRVKAMGLSRYLRAQNRDAELRRDGEKAYADIFESLVGAIYLDSYQNDNLIRAFILRQLGIEPKRLPADIESFDYDSLSTPIPSLSEYRESPVTEETYGEEIPAEAEAEASVTPAAEEVTPTEMAPVEAEAAAETVTFEARTAETVAEVPSAASTAEPAPTPKQEALAALCEALGYDLPTYGETPKNAPNARPVAACTLKYKDAKGKLVKISLNDSGRTLAEATEKAAAKMLKKLEKQAAESAAKAEIPQPADAVSEAQVEAAPVEATPVEATPVEATPIEIAPVEVTSVEDVPVEATPVEVTSVEDVPVEVASVEDAPVEAAPVEAAPAEGLPAEEPAVVETEPVTESMTEAESAPVEEAAPAGESSPVEEVAPAEEVAPIEEVPPVEETKTDKVGKEKKVPAKKTGSKSKKVEKPVEPKEDAPAAETLTEASAPAESVVEASAAEAKPAKAKKAPVKKKSPQKADKSAEETAVAEVATEAPVAPEADKPVKKKAPAKKKSTPKSDQSAEESKSDSE